MGLHEAAGKTVVTATFELPALQEKAINVFNGRLTISAASNIHYGTSNRGIPPGDSWVIPSSSENVKNVYAVRERRYGRLSYAPAFPDNKVSVENS